MVSEGDKAPTFTLPDSGGEKVTLKDFEGKRVVLYFYPKDDTPGCTIEACGFRDMKPEFEKRGAAILGISPDDSESHTKFAGKYKLPFTLLADAGAKVAAKYGVWVEKNMMGHKFMGVNRTTFVIGKTGKIEKIFAKVNPLGHNKEVLTWLDAQA
ncbi:MAG: thioredoxin-dependent thiol peroxidase [Candidatus Micrarchaeota archaeon]|nr:thioredoxin-dependent thiol peroxidase [Candidatus Micrarchaeota archaeon]